MILLLWIKAIQENVKMQKKPLTLTFLLALSFNLQAKDFDFSIEDQNFMSGYTYEYKDPDCKVVWHDRSASFLIADSENNKCDQISQKKLVSDALKSIEYVKSKGNYENFLDYYSELELRKTPYSIQKANIDAKNIWIKGCLAYKKGLSTKDFGAANKLWDTTLRYPKIKRHLVIKLYGNGWQMALNNQGFINCEEIGYYMTQSFLNGVGDIRD